MIYKVLFTNLLYLQYVMKALGKISIYRGLKACQDRGRASLIATVVSEIQNFFISHWDTRNKILVSLKKT